MTEEERCKQTAQDRLRDALFLFEKERYEATLYMCGYVIEIGIKAEFHRLANRTLTSLEDEDKSDSTIKHLFKADIFKDKDGKSPEWMTNFKFPKTILEYAKFINDIGLLKTVTVSGKDVDNKIAASNEFQVILTNRPSTKSHDIPAFLASLNEWKIAIGENSVKEVEGYKIDALLGWGTHLRYGESGSNNKEVQRPDSMEALQMAIKFLEQVVLVDVSKFKNQLHDILNPNKEPIPDNIGED